jgi:hypothetical protein
MGTAPSTSKKPINEDTKDWCTDDEIEIIDGPLEGSLSKDVKPKIRRLEVTSQFSDILLSSSFPPSVEGAPASTCTASQLV